MKRCTRGGGRPPQLRIIANFAVGHNNIDIPACTARGVAVSNTPDVLTDTTADHAVMLLLGNRAPRSSRATRSCVRARGGAGRRISFWDLDVTGKTLGIVGMGRIGRAVAERAEGFKMKLLYHNRSTR